jgi:glycosyltransferase involved in cell wall biosynthesis
MENNLRSLLNDNDKIDIFAMIPDQNEMSYSLPVVQSIRKNIPDDYNKAALQINSNYDIVIVQFEHGIYGGNDGIFILLLLRQLSIPSITILHTVLKKPSLHQRIVIHRMAKYCSKIIVMAEKAIEFLSQSYFVDPKKLSVIAHGVPDYQNHKPNLSKKELGWSKKQILMTFGLISTGKGYEYVIKALPTILQKHTNILFVIIGQTHPNTLENEGEKYRNELKQIIKNFHLENQVLFIDRHVSEEELMDYLRLADFYICPYLNEAQITSGTLSYALGSGALILATPFWHSKELCDKGYILNFPFKDPQALSRQIIKLMSNNQLLEKLKIKSTSYGQTLSWPNIAQRYFKLLTQTITTTPTKHPTAKTLPSIDFSYLRKITKEKGVMQHADSKNINFEEGYCLDDNARALICLLSYSENHFTETPHELIDIYFKFIEQAQTSSGRFLNFASFPELNFYPAYSEDACGRATWSLGQLLSMPQMANYHQRAQKLINKNTPHIATLKSIRGIANCLIGYSLLKDINITNLLANRLLFQHKNYNSSEWNWFENSLNYDNGILPLSLLYAYKFTKNIKYKEVALQTLHFLNTVHFNKGYLSIIGNENWYVNKGIQADFSQQPIDAMASVLANSKAFEITNEIKYRDFALQSMEWFYGENIRCAPLYDTISKACHDGLNNNGITENQGAESTIVYLMARIEIEKLIV